MYSDKSITKYLDDLAAKKPAPGGGSSAALAGAMAAAIICMVLNYTIGKKKYKSFEPAAKNLLKKAQASMRKLIKLFDADIKSYGNVVKARENKVLKRALKEAMAVPLEVARESAFLTKMCPVVKRRANKDLACDVDVARYLLAAAINSANVNVAINRKALKKVKV
ncbi:MAG: cyclodeaminase/cyclohydrolase family protein [Candidatus Omnitrophica bacterium]|nr:cyclodeaminase/cyclohydrolase family protein [Candidatus Omnitrophota bacterium]